MYDRADAQKSQSIHRLFGIQPGPAPSRRKTVRGISFKWIAARFRAAAVSGADIDRRIVGVVVPATLSTILPSGGKDAQSSPTHGAPDRSCILSYSGCGDAGSARNRSGQTFRVVANKIGLAGGYRFTE